MLVNIMKFKRTTLRWTPTVIALLTLSATSLKSLAQTDVMNAPIDDIRSAENEEIVTDYYKDWYHVEVIIFEQTAYTPSTNLDENWPKNISLGYPSNLQLLTLLQDELDADLDEAKGSEEAQVLPEDTAPIDGEKPTGLLGDAGPQLSAMAGTDPLNRKIINSIQEDAESALLNSLEAPFETLSPEQHILADESSKLSRSRRSRILFHHAWRQPIVDKDQAPSIAIRGGDRFDKNNELEGSITLHVSRYLHLQTNLWLSRFSPNFGQPSAFWPNLPVQPEPLPEIAPQLGETELSDDSDPSSISTLSNTPFDEAINSRWDTFSTGNFEITQEQDTQGVLSDYSELTEKPFLPTNIVTIKQGRRMRSGELHYLDHPKLGILLKIEKYEPDSAEILQALAASQRAGDEQEMDKTRKNESPAGQTPSTL